MANNNGNASNFNYAQTLMLIFNGKSYDFQSIQMKTLLISQDLWDIEKEGYEALANPQELSTWIVAMKKQYKQNFQKDAKALLFIQQRVSKIVFPRIRGAKIAKTHGEF